MAIKIEGIGEVVKKIDDIADTDSIQKGLQQACLKLERSAKYRAPKDTGALRRSITSEVSGLTGKVFTPLEYAPYVEYGTGLFAEKGGRKDVPWWYRDDEGKLHKTSGQHPHPFMRPALEAHRKEIIKIVREAMLGK